VEWATEVDARNKEIEYFADQLEALEAENQDLKEHGAPGDQIEALEDECRKWKNNFKKIQRKETDLLDEIERLELLIKISKVKTKQRDTEEFHEKQRSKSREV
jgi:hypothetical protein